MRPTSRELIERIADALNETVLPAISDDKWAASVVRSATTLLNHLAQRVEIEIPVLIADNEDVQLTLQAVAGSLASSGRFATLVNGTTRILHNDAPMAGHDAAALDARNRVYQEAVEALLRGLYEPSRDDAAAASCRTVLRNYLARRRERERDIYFPAFIGPPF